MKLTFMIQRVLCTCTQIT